MVLNCTYMLAIQCTANQIHHKITKEDTNKFPHFTQIFDTHFLSKGGLLVKSYSYTQYNGRMALS